MEDAKSAGANSMGLNGVFFQEITEAMPVPPPIGEDQADSEPQSFGASDSGLNKVMQKTLDTFISGVDIDLMHPIFNDSIVVNSQSSDEPIMEEESPEEEEREDAGQAGHRAPLRRALSQKNSAVVQSGSKSQFLPYKLSDAFATIGPRVDLGKENVPASAPLFVLEAAKAASERRKNESSQTKTKGRRGILIASTGSENRVQSEERPQKKPKPATKKKVARKRKVKVEKPAPAKKQVPAKRKAPAARDKATPARVTRSAAKTIKAEPAPPPPSEPSESESDEFVGATTQMVSDILASGLSRTPTKAKAQPKPKAKPKPKSKKQEAKEQEDRETRRRRQNKVASAKFRKGTGRVATGCSSWKQRMRSLREITSPSAVTCARWPCAFLCLRTNKNAGGYRREQSPPPFIHADTGIGPQC